MSSTGRGKARVPFDYYPTPPWCAHRLLDRHASDLGFGRRLNAPLLLEPTVGDGAICRAVDGWIARAPHYEMEHRWVGVELRRGALLEETDLEAHFEGVDFRSWCPYRAGVLEVAAIEGYPDERFDGSIGNPPFVHAEDIVRRTLEIAQWAAMLLRAGFLSSADRVPFWRTVGLDPWIRVLPDRPSFDGEGTDSATYAWFVWGDVELAGPRVDVLDPTPAEVRAAQKPAPPTGLPQVELSF